MSAVSDYLVVGAGAMGMAFVDVLMTETDATVTMVDQHGRPGGHWNDAYPFVRLHQPSTFYGVNSRPLGGATKDATGGNKGLYELASGTEVVTYFDQVMQQQFLPSGRVRYFPMCSYTGNGRFTSLLTGEQHQIAVRRKTVDATYMHVTVPSVQPPNYAIAPEVSCVPPNDLPKTSHPPAGHVVIGGGKTAMDAVLWLLANGVDADDITWIIPRDSWIIDRANVQPGEEFAERSVGAAVRQVEVTAASTSIDDLFDRLHSEGLLLRLDDDVRPSMYRCATVTVAELDELRRISNVVRQGRVQRIEADRIVLDQGSIPTTTGHLHIDCTADGLERRPVLPVFDGDRITLQTVRTCQQVFSAAFVAHVEAAYDDESAKNDLCTVVPHPNTDIDWLRTSLANNLNMIRWRQDGELAAWLAEARLDGFSRVRTAAADATVSGLIGRMVVAMPAALSKLEEHLANQPSD